ncbi:MAG: preprotein translocase subunit Sec61beta [Halobacteria archaeon]
MAPEKSSKDSGLMSAAGLMRYYESEESVVKFSPQTVLWVAILTCAGVLLINVYYGKFP